MFTVGEFEYLYLNYNAMHGTNHSNQVCKAIVQKENPGMTDQTFNDWERMFYGAEGNEVLKIQKKVREYRDAHASDADFDLKMEYLRYEFIYKVNTMFQEYAGSHNFNLNRYSKDWNDAPGFSTSGPNMVPPADYVSPIFSGENS